MSAFNNLQSNLAITCDGKQLWRGDFLGCDSEGCKVLEWLGDRPYCCAWRSTRFASMGMDPSTGLLVCLHVLELDAPFNPDDALLFKLTFG